MHSQKKFIPEGLSAFLDNARWIAALLVVINHVNTRFFPKFSHTNPLERSVGDYVWTFFSGFSHHSVVIFFVLSGYLVGGRLLVSAMNGYGFHWRRYFVDRVARIYLVLIPVLGLTYLFDSSGIELFGTPVYGDGVPGSLSIGVLFGNFFNLQDFIVVPYGTNGPLYTLANEFWYYISFPLLISPILVSGVKRYLLFVSGALLTGLFSWLSPWHGLGFVLWILGALVAIIPNSFLASRKHFFFAAFVAYLIVVRLSVRGEEISFFLRSLLDVGVALLCCSVIYALRFEVGGHSSSSPRFFSKAAADCSYSLYAIHVPILNLSSAYMNEVFGFGYKSGVQHFWQWLLVFLVIALICVSAYFFGRVTEARTLTVRFWAYRLLGIPLKN